MVRIQAQTMLPATPSARRWRAGGAHADDGAGDGVGGGHWHAHGRWQEQRHAPRPVSAQKPPTGLSLVIFWPMVLTMRQPPNMVPRPMAA